MDYTDNQVRVYQNSCLKLYEENDLQNLESTFGEIKELIELFGKHESDEKLMLLSLKEEYYFNIFEPKIKEAKRVLKNTEKRITYNSERC
jgi:hypothetical protein